MIIPYKFSPFGKSYFGGGGIPSNDLTFIAEVANARISLAKSGSVDLSGIEYRVKNTNWTSYIEDTQIILTNVGDWVQFRNTKNSLSINTSNYAKFKILDYVKAVGNINSLINYSNLSNYCFSNLFNNCEITDASELELPATSLANFCYRFLFYQCEDLVYPPELPATSLASNCYYGMFWECHALAYAPELPATTLATSCYHYMFYGCFSLTDAPYLPATSLATNCYNYMFYYCTALSAINVEFTEWANTSNWVDHVAQNGVFTKPTELSAQFGTSYIPTNWQVINPPKYLTLTALEDDSKVSLSAIGTPTTSGLQYKIGTDENWSDYTINDEITLSAGEFVEFRNTADTLNLGSNNEVKFVTSGKLKATGEVISMINYATLSDQCLRELFRDNTALYDVSEMIFPDGDNSAYKQCFSNFFRGCTNITDMPELPATGVGQSFYTSMFQGCTSLTGVTVLPATTLIQRCYNSMFYGCTSLTTAPVISATVLAERCYTSMFDACTSLINAPELPATSLGLYCYYYMFRRCTSLTTAPELPATILAANCYQSMFEGCTSLINAPSELPATESAASAYRGMFQNCTSLTTAPEIKLSATTANSYTLRDMFKGCTSLNKITVNFTSWTNATTNWVDGVSANGVFMKPDELPTQFGINTIPSGWKVQAPIPNVLRLIADEDNSTLTLNKTQAASAHASGLKYKGVNDSDWQSYAIGTTLTLASGEFVDFKNLDSTFSGPSYNYAYLTFAMTGKFKAEGNMQSMVNYETNAPSSCFQNLFQNCTSLYDASRLLLPALNVGKYCYEYMFDGCTNLTDGPELPASGIAARCYYYMFNNCTRLSGITSELPAPEVFERSYQYMFSNCVSLTDTPIILGEPSTNSSSMYCMCRMFYGCSALTGVTQYLYGTVASQGCYQNMFRDCILLTDAPEILITSTSASDWADSMFKGCASLSSITVNFTNWNETDYWVEGVPGNGVFTKPTDLSENYGDTYIPNGWTVVNK